MKKTYLIAGIILLFSISIVTSFEMRNNWKMYHGKAYLVAEFSSTQRDFEMYQLDSGHTVLCTEEGCFWAEVRYWETYFEYFDESLARKFAKQVEPIVIPSNSNGFDLKDTEWINTSNDIVSQGDKCYVINDERTEKSGIEYKCIRPHGAEFAFWVEN